MFSINFHLEINNPEECATIEQEFAEEIKKRGDDFKFFKDQVQTASNLKKNPIIKSWNSLILYNMFFFQFGEHPEERALNEEHTEKLECVTTINEIYAAIKVLFIPFRHIKIENTYK